MDGYGNPLGRKNKKSFFTPLRDERSFDILFAVGTTRPHKDKDKERTKTMKNKVMDAIENAVSMMLEGILLTLPLWVVAVGGSAVVGIAYLCK